VRGGEREMRRRGDEERGEKELGVGKLKCINKT
jgi:hypothetical protein